MVNQTTTTKRVADAETERRFHAGRKAIRSALTDELELYLGPTILIIIGKTLNGAKHRELSRSYVFHDTLASLDQPPPIGR